MLPRAPLHEAGEAEDGVSASTNPGPSAQAPDLKGAANVPIPGSSLEQGSDEPALGEAQAVHSIQIGASSAGDGSLGLSQNRNADCSISDSNVAPTVEATAAAKTPPPNNPQKRQKVAFSLGSPSSKHFNLTIKGAGARLGKLAIADALKQDHKGKSPEPSSTRAKSEDANEKVVERTLKSYSPAPESSQNGGPSSGVKPSPSKTELKIKATSNAPLINRFGLHPPNEDGTRRNSSEYATATSSEDNAEARVKSEQAMPIQNDTRDDGIPKSGQINATKNGALEVPTRVVITKNATENGAVKGATTVERSIDAQDHHINGAERETITSEGWGERETDWGETEGFVTRRRPRSPSSDTNEPEAIVTRRRQRSPSGDRDKERFGHNYHRERRNPAMRSRVWAGQPNVESSERFNGSKLKHERFEEDSRRNRPRSSQGDYSSSQSFHESTQSYHDSSQSYHGFSQSHQESGQNHHEESEEIEQMKARFVRKVESPSGKHEARKETSSTPLSAGSGQMPPRLLSPVIGFDERCPEGRSSSQSSDRREKLEREQTKTPPLPKRLDVHNSSTQAYVGSERSVIRSDDRHGVKNRNDWQRQSYTRPSEPGKGRHSAESNAWERREQDFAAKGMKDSRFIEKKSTPGSHFEKEGNQNRDLQLHTLPNRPALPLPPSSSKSEMEVEEFRTLQNQPSEFEQRPPPISAPFHPPISGTVSRIGSASVSAAPSPMAYRSYEEGPPKSLQLRKRSRYYDTINPPFIIPLPVQPRTPLERRGEWDRPLESHRFVGSSNITDYTLQEKLGEGTFGIVWKGIRGSLGHDGKPNSYSKPSAGAKVKDGDVVALKEIILHNESDGMPITSLREIRILKALDHPSVVPVVDMAYQDGDAAQFRLGKTFMVFPYMDHDLAGLLENHSVKLVQSQIKQYSKQLLQGTAYLHKNGILHRDMKAANLLINNEGCLMIADFGLARSVELQSSAKEYTNCVVTRWYRPPEILLGDRMYHTPVDIWGVGCVIAEMFNRTPIFPGSSDIDQADRIFQWCGEPNEDSMPGCTSLPGCDGKKTWPIALRKVLIEAGRLCPRQPEFADFLDKILVLDPRRRMTAIEALDHDWLWTEPLPMEPKDMPKYTASHEYDRRKRDKLAQAGYGISQQARVGANPASVAPNSARRPTQMQQHPAMVPPGMSIPSNNGPPAFPIPGGAPEMVSYQQNQNHQQVAHRHAQSFASNQPSNHVHPNMPIQNGPSQSFYPVPNPPAGNSKGHPYHQQQRDGGLGGRPFFNHPGGHGASSGSNTVKPKVNINMMMAGRAARPPNSNYGAPR